MSPVVEMEAWPISFSTAFRFPVLSSNRCPVVRVDEIRLELRASALIVFGAAGLVGTRSIDRRPA